MMTIGRPDNMGGDVFKYYKELDREDDLFEGERRVSTTQGQASRLIKEPGFLDKSVEGQDIKLETFESLINAKDPVKGGHLIASEARRAAAGGKFKHIEGWDIVFSPDKSVSVAWALADDKLKEQIARSSKNAADRAMIHFEKHLAFTRVGAGGKEHQQLVGAIWTRFDHHTSRDLDPQLHHHNFLYNIGLRADGSFGALHSKYLFQNQKVLDQIYQAELAQGLEKAGFSLEHNGVGGFRIQGIPRHLSANFSKRRHAIMQAAKEYGYRTPGGLARAAERTRDAKVYLPTSALHQIWQEQGHQLGFGQEQLMQLYRGQRGTFKPRSIAKEISNGLRERGVPHLFKGEEKQLSLVDAKSPLDQMRGAGLGKSKQQGKSLVRGVARDIGGASKLLQKGGKSLVRAAMPLGAAHVLSQATKLQKAAQKTRLTQSVSKSTPTRAPQQRDKDRDPDRER